MENKRIMKALRSGNDFKYQWFVSEKYLRLSFPIHREIGTEMRSELLQSWLRNRKG